MNRVKQWLLLFLAAVWLMACGCGAQETAEPVRESVPAASPSEPEPVNGLIREGDSLTYWKDGTPEAFAPGVQEIDGKAYYVESDGETVCGLQNQTAQASDGCRYYFEDDSSLRRFGAGFTELPDGVYYVENDGYALAAFSEETAVLDGARYAFDSEGRVLSFEAGVQEIFGKLYLLPESGSAIPLYGEGTLLRGLDLYYVQADGSLLADSDVGYLHFGSDGRYTSGNEILDADVAGLFAACLTGGEVDTEEMLRAAYTYIRDNFKYLSMDHQEAGSTDWAEDSALKFFELGKGNCYCWAATVAYCARQLGYQAYVVAGWESNPENDHAWTMIDWPDGETYLFDAQLEYAYWYMFSGKPKIDMFKASGDGSTYNGFAFYFP